MASLFLCSPWTPTCPGKLTDRPSVSCRYHVNPDRSCRTQKSAQDTTCAARTGNTGYRPGVPPRTYTATSAEKPRGVSRVQSHLRTAKPFVPMRTCPNHHQQRCKQPRPEAASQHLLLLQVQPLTQLQLLTVNNSPPPLKPHHKPLAQLLG